MKIQTNHSLKNFNTFGVEVSAEHFVEVHSQQDILAAIKLNQQPIYVLGGGSNLLLTKNQEGLILKNNILGKEITRSFKHTHYVAVGGGENWHDLVQWTLKKGLNGLENLSLIPGTVGAAPVQNIGAYGVELASVFHKLHAIHLTTGKRKTFFKKDCQFGYRDSIFKNELRNQYFITGVWFKLSTQQNVHLRYGAIQDTLLKLKLKPTPKNISQAIIQIRQQKLPDPAKLGNSGSFFKNPEVSKTKFNQLLKQFPDIKSYPLPNGEVKIPAAWLIEKCGWKGKRVGDTGTYQHHALIIVNHGKASGDEILKCSEQIQKAVLKKFGIRIEVEIRVDFL